MANIANLSVGLTLAAGGFYAGLTKAQNQLGSLKMAFGAISGVALGLAGAATFAQLVDSSMKAIDANAKLSDRLNISTEALVGLQHGADLAGVGSEELTVALSKLQRNIGAAANGSIEAQDSFRKFGLDAKELANVPLDEALNRVTDATNALPTSFSRSAAQVELFGKAGQRLNAFLAEGSDGFKRSIADATTLGLAYSRIDAAKVEQANDAMTRAAAVVKGLGNTIMIEVSPFIAAMADEFTNVSKSSMNMGEIVHETMHTMLWSIEQTVKGFQLLEVSVLNVRGGAQRFWAWLVEQNAGGAQKDRLTQLWGEIGRTDEAIAKLGGSIQNSPLPAMFERIRAKAAEMAKATAAAAKAKPTDGFISPEVVEGVGKLNRSLQEQFDTLGMLGFEVEGYKLKQKGATEAQLAFSKTLGINTEIKKLSESFRDQAATIGMSAAEVELYKLKMHGATDAQLAMTKAAGLNSDVTKLNQSLSEQVKLWGLNATEIELYKLKQRGATDEILKTSRASMRWLEAMKIKESNFTPLEKFQKHLIDTKRLFGGEFEDITDIADAKVFMELEQSVKAPEIRQPQAVVAGSAAAESLILKAQQSTRDTPEERVEKILEAAKRTQDAQLKELRDIARALRKEPVVLELVKK